MLENGKMVKSWPLDKVVVEELLPFCSAAAFGDLKTQTTVVDPSVRLAYDLLAEGTEATTTPLSEFTPKRTSYR